MSVIGLVAFVAVILTVLGLVHLYIWWRVVRSTTRAGGRGRRNGTRLIVAAFGFVAAALIAALWLGPKLAAPLVWVGFSWLGLAFYLFLFLLVGELVRLATRLVGARRAPRQRMSGLGERDPGGFGQNRQPDDPDPGGLPANRQPDDGVEAESGVRTLARAEAGPNPGGFGRNRQTEPADPNDHEIGRRLFLSRSIALGAGVAAAGVAGYGMSRALGAPVVRRVPVQIAGLDPRLAGFRIATFSDAHLGAIRRRAAMQQLVDTVNGTEPDLVAVLGDLIDGSVADLGDAVAPITGLDSPHGSFFVTGNHEYYSGVREWTDRLTDLGVRVLANERQVIERADGAGFDLAGVNDVTGAEGGAGGGPDFELALGGRPGNRPVVLLAHQPITVERADSYGVDLQLSGHTHGGQLWPFDYLIAAQQGAVSGLSRIGDTQLYVTSGAGFWGPPMRVGADPEVTVIELYPDSGVTPPDP